MWGRIALDGEKEGGGTVRRMAFCREIALNQSSLNKSTWPRSLLKAAYLIKSPIFHIYGTFLQILTFWAAAGLYGVLGEFCCCSLISATFLGAGTWRNEPLIIWGWKKRKKRRQPHCVCHPRCWSEALMFTGAARQEAEPPLPSYRYLQDHMWRAIVPNHIWGVANLCGGLCHYHGRLWD